MNLKTITQSDASGKVGQSLATLRGMIMALKAQGWCDSLRRAIRIGHARAASRRPTFANIANLSVYGDVLFILR
jgi:hypothetical protein